MYSEALVRMTGEAGRSLTLSWPGSAWSRGHSWSVADSDVTVIYQISARDQSDLIFFITDDWMLTDSMCLTVRPVLFTLIIRAAANE